MPDETSNRIDGDTTGPIVQARSVYGGVYVNSAPPPDPRTEVQSLLRAQIQAAQDLPRMLPGARRPALSDVYVRQDLGSGVDTSRAEPPRPRPILDGHGQLVEVPSPPAVRIAVRPPVRTVREALDNADHLVVTGGAGQGKSTLSLRLAADAALRWLDDGAAPLSETVVPLRLTARTLAARLQMPFAEALADSVRADYGAFLLRCPVTAGVLSDRVDGCRWLLLIDGLDEVADGDDRDRLVKVLASCAAESPYRVVLTTRPIEGAALAPLHRIGAVRYELQPFDDEALQRFAANWFADEGPDRFLRQIRTCHLDALVRVPLLATIAAIVFQQHADRPLPDNQYELYEAYFAYLREIRPADRTFEPHRVHLLEHLGLVRLESDTSLVAAARDWIRCQISPSELRPGWPEQLTEFLVAVGPLVRRGDDMTFLHHSFAEHLAATATARQLPETFAPDHEDFARLLHAARPRERGRYARAVTLHYTHLHPDQTDALLQSLHSGGAEQHLLIARLLAKRMPASSTAIDAFLGTVRGWATTTHYLARDILAYTCRATQHAGLAPWLFDLMGDSSLPSASRTEAAAALAVRLRGPHSPAALSFLRSLIDDPSVAVEDRLAAAEALADSGKSDRQAAERGLRSVLTDPYAAGDDYRTAAVLLAAFGGEARVFAVSSLLAHLDDRNTAPSIVVEAATGLVEIGPEFVSRAAEGYRLVLHDRVHSEAWRGEAALGLASLGTEFLSEATDALASVVADTRRARVDRASAAEVLARMGPQYRQPAGENVQAIMDEPTISPLDIYWCATKLANFGPAFRADAGRRLRDMIAHRGPTDWVEIRALEALVEFDLLSEADLARRLWELVDAGNPTSNEYRTALHRLIQLGEPHRTSAIGRLRTQLADGNTAVAARCNAASGLIDAGPEFHAEATRQLLAIVENHGDGEAAVDAWRLLVQLQPQLHQRALDVLLRNIRTATEHAAWLIAANSYVTSEADVQVIADAMVSRLSDKGKTFHERERVLTALVTLGPKFHERAVRELCVLLKSVRTMVFDFRYVASQVQDVGIGLREQVARTLIDLMRAPTASILRVRSILAALETLGFLDTDEARAALRTVIEYAELPGYRIIAQCMLTAVDADAVSAVASEVLVPAGGVNTPWWPGAVGQLATLGTDVAPRLLALLTRADTRWSVRWTSALCLYTSFPKYRVEAETELDRQVTDPHHYPGMLAQLLAERARLGADFWRQGIDRLAELVVDDRLSIAERCEIAFHYGSIDRSVAQRMSALIHRLADDPHRTAAERVEAIDNARRLESWLALPVLARPVADAALGSGGGELREFLTNSLRRDLRTRVERTLLEDRSLPIAQRLPRTDIWDDMPLADEVYAELREVMTQPEFRLGERVDAAKALVELDIRSSAEGTGFLDGVGTFRAKKALMLIGAERGRQVRGEVERTAMDEERPLRERQAAVNILLQTSPRTSPNLVGVLREIIAGRGVSAKIQAEARMALGAFDGLAAARVLRDDKQTPPGVRWQLADELSKYMPEDSAAAARNLEAIATDAGAPAALRWRAAQSLVYRGRPGRDAAVKALREMAEDVALPVTARANAASTLGKVSPNTRGEVLGMLREMLEGAKPLQRRKVWLLIGKVRPEEAALELMGIAKDERHTAVERMRCAQGAVSLWRDCRDRASVVVRKVAKDKEVPWHMRRQAACYLARWSEVCREEARELIREVDESRAASGPRRGRPGCSG